MKRHELIMVILSAFVFVLTPAVALCSEMPAVATPASAVSPQQSAPELQAGGSDPLFFSGRGLTPTESNCSANCGSGSSVSCSGPSCSAVDRNCDIGQRGYCTGSGGTTYCPEECYCIVTVDCAEYPDVSCVSWTSSSACGAVDRDCSIGQRGYCWPGSRYTPMATYCGPECPCEVMTYCGVNGPISCQGSGSGACAVSEGCWVECDNYRTYCPGMNESCIPN